MFDKNKVTGAPINVKYCGYDLQSPFILGSGPLTYGSEGMIRAHQAGIGAVVTKTIRLGAAINPAHHMAKISNEAILNCEKWADSDRFQWYEKEIPETVKAGAIVIGSVGHTPMEAEAIVADVEKAGAHIIELVSYTEDTLLPMLDYAKAHVSIPVICKLSGNWPDTAGTARKCYEHGADGVCAIDSIGPTLMLDIENRRPVMMSNDGYGWMTGAPIKPISMRINSQITRGVPGYKNLYGTGGVMKADDAIEYLMVGCNAVGICSVGIMKGLDYVEKMCYQLSERLKALGFASIQDAVGVALPNWPVSENITDMEFAYNADKCTKCHLCEKVCCYQARTLDVSGEKPEMKLNRAECRSCGLCADVCPTKALTAWAGAQSEENKARAAASKRFDQLVHDQSPELLK